MPLERGKTGQGYDQHVPPDVPPLKHYPLMFACVRCCSQSRIGGISEQLRTPTNSLHLTGGQGVAGSNPASPKRM